MTYLLLAVSVLAAFFLEWTLGQKISLWFVPPPFTAFVLLYWFWTMKFSSRLWTAVIAGILFDSVSAYPAGTYSIVFAALGVGTEFFKFFFSNVESVLTRSISIGALTFMFLSITPVWGHLIGVSFGPAASRFLSWGISSHLIGAAAMWAAASVFLFSAAALLYRKR